MIINIIIMIIIRIMKYKYHHHYHYNNHHHHNNTHTYTHIYLPVGTRLFEPVPSFLEDAPQTIGQVHCGTPGTFLEGGRQESVSID